MARGHSNFNMRNVQAYWRCKPREMIGPIAGETSLYVGLLYPLLRRISRESNYIIG